eukprot:489092-Pyramimonas_sp.AAC.1
MSILAPTHVMMEPVPDVWDTDVVEGAVNTDEGVDRFLQGDEACSLVFSVISKYPVCAKRAVPGELTRSDVGIAVHRLVSGTTEPKDEDTTLMISSAPAHIMTSMQTESDFTIPSQPLVLQPDMLPLASGQEALAWSPHDDQISYRWDRRSFPDGNSMRTRKFTECMWSHLEYLVGGDEERELEADNDELKICMNEGLLARRVAGDRVFYRLTDAGKQAVMP